MVVFGEDHLIPLGIFLLYIMRHLSFSNGDSIPSGILPVPFFSIFS